MFKAWLIGLVYLVIRDQNGLNHHRLWALWLLTMYLGSGASTGILVRPPGYKTTGEERQGDIAA